MIGMGIGWFGFGAERWRLRLGVIEAWVSRGSPIDLLHSAHETLGRVYVALAEAGAELRKRGGEEKQA